MRHLGLRLLIVALIACASGVASLALSEPCSGNELAGDNACPPTCATCGCCARAAEPAPTGFSASPSVLTDHFTAPLPHLFSADPRDILHVPKTGLL
jgi:hypothetical protein